MNYTYTVLTEKQAENYLYRINFKGISNNSLECLNQLIYCHHTSVPFENLDVYYQKLPLSLEINDLFDKIVTRKRGGYCFEMNGLFICLLRTLGFNAWSCMCRVTHDENTPRPISHRGNMVIIDNKHYFCDVGFGGPMPCGALLLEDGKTQEILGEEFTPILTNEGWWKIMRGNQCTLMVNEAFLDPVDFIPLSDACSLKESAIFRKQIMVNLRTKTGHLSITANTFTKVIDGIREEYTITSKDELRTILDKYFELSL